MSKTKLKITIGRESTPEEIVVIRELFSKDFDAEIDNTLMRLSQGDLPMTVYIFLKDTIIAGITFEILKNIIMKFFQTKPIKRRTGFVIRKTETSEEMMIGERGVTICKKKIITKYETMEEAFKDFQ